MKFNVWSVISCLFLIYIANSIYHLYKLYFPEMCKMKNDKDCLNSAIDKTNDLELRLYYSLNGGAVNFETNKIWTVHNFDMSKELSSTFEVILPQRTRKNGTLWVHAFLLPSSAKDEFDPRRSVWHQERKYLMTFYGPPVAETIQLMGKEETKQKTQSNVDRKIVNHWRSVLPLAGVGESLSFDWNNVPGKFITDPSLFDQSYNFLHF